MRCSRYSYRGITRSRAARPDKWRLAAQQSAPGLRKGRARRALNASQFGHDPQSNGRTPPHAVSVVIAFVQLSTTVNRHNKQWELRVTPSWGPVSRPYSGLVSRPRMAPLGTPCRATAYQRIVSVPRQAETSPPPPRRHSRIVTRSATQQEQELNVTVHASLPPFRGTARAVRFGTLISHACQEYENDNCTKLNMYASSGDETGTNRFSAASLTRIN